MAKFCTKCGKELLEGEVCNCKKNGLLASLKALVGAGVSATPENDSILERTKKIVPDSIRPDAGELPIKQYCFARLRSRFRGQYAEGRLQVTNKRLLFRAPGISSLGKTIEQKEFSINEIAGIEVKKGNRISALNVFLCIILSLFISSMVESVFDALRTKSEFLATFLSYILVAASCGSLVFCKKHCWLQLTAFAVGLGSLLGTTGEIINPIDIVVGFELVSLRNILVFIVSIGWLFAMFRVCFVPDLTFSVKTKSSSEVFQIRRRVWGLFFKTPQEYTGYSEVLPWRDTDKVAEELGAMISDLQTMGDMAIDSWSED